MALFRWFIVRRLREEPLRTAVTVTGVAAGVAVVLAIQLANASSVAGFAAALEAVAGKTSLEIIGAGAGIDERRLADMGWLRQFGAVSPVIEGDTLLRVSASSRSELVRVLGVDILRDTPIREYRLIDFGGEGKAPPARQLLELLVDPASILVTETFAGRHGLELGAEVEMAIGDRVARMRIRGVLRSVGPARALDGNFVLMDIAAAQLAFDRLGRIDRVDVRLHDPARLDEAEAAIAARLGPGLEAQRPARRGEQVEKMLSAFHFNLSALSGVALLVGLFLVHNTIATSAIARRAEIGMLRAVGASRGTVLGLFLGEALALGLAGCALGVPLGWLLAHGAVRLTSTAVAVLYVAEAAALPPIDASQVMLAFGVGVPLALASAVAPGREASRVSPLDALRPTSALNARERPRATWMAASVVCLATAALTASLGPVNGLPVFGFVSALAVVFGLALLVPAALWVLTRLGRKPLARLFGVEGRLAHANVASAIPRLSVSVGALAVSLAMLVAIAVMVGSFRETVVYWVEQTLQADLYLSTARRSDIGTPSSVSPELEAIVAGDPAVAAVNPFRSLSLSFRDRLIVVVAGDFAVLQSHGRLIFKAPADQTTALAQAIGRDAVLVSESFARRFDVDVGQTIELNTPAGPKRFTVAAVYYDYSTDRGVVAMDRATFARYWGALRPTSLSIYLAPGHHPAQVHERILEKLGERHRAFLNTNASLRREVLRVFDSTFAITYALEAIAIVVAILGITAAMVTLVLERRADLTLLRLVGADRAQVRRTIVIEAALIGIASQALAAVAGFLLALILIYVVNVQSFGWTIQFHAPVAFLTQASLALLVATVAAGLYPAHLATRHLPLRELATE